MLLKKLTVVLVPFALLISSKAFANDREFIDTLLLDAQYAMEQGLTVNSFALTQTVLKHDNSRYEAYYIQSQLHLKELNYKKSLQSLKKAISLAPPKRAKQLKKIQSEISLAIENSKTDLMVDKALKAMDQNHYYEAGEILSQAWRATPREWNVLQMAIDAWLISESHSQLLKLIDESEAHSVPEKLQLSLTVLKQQLTSIAEEDYQALIDNARLAFEQNDKNKSLSILNNAIRRYPQYSEAYLMAASLLTEQGKQRKALEHLERAKKAAGFTQSSLLEFPELSPLLSSEEAIALVSPVIGKDAAQHIASNKITLPKRKKKQTPKQIINKLGMTFRYIPPGTFSMGSPEGESGRDWKSEQQHSVTLSQGYYISTTEVTQAQWNSLMSENPSRYQGDQLPVHRVSQLQARAFLNKLSEREGLNYRLPTEAEWEYACRAGSTTPYSGFKDKSQLDWAAWSSIDSSRSKPEIVAKKDANAYGLFDMHGNVYEWVSDLYAPHADHTVRNPSGPSAGNHIVIKGGSWSSYASGLRCAHRAKVEKGSLEMDIGFRVVQEIK